MGWQTAARGHESDRLPERRQEYLGIDVMAFPAEPGPSWPLPVAVFELENQQKRAAYALWKLICVRAKLRVLFAYRNDWQQVQQLVAALRTEVIDSLEIEQRMELGDSTVLVTGSRGEERRFPYGFFKIWRLEANTGRFQRSPGWQ